ncbi:MAG: hypothetical protein H7Y42_13910 [Chitinophagaceae bacterium]|nr:hypothetical protein [Chitinophagaceae bacterium]
MKTALKPYVQNLGVHLAKLFSMCEQYNKVTRWLNRYGEIKKDWVEELRRLNSEAMQGRNVSGKRFMHLDILLELRQIDKAEKISCREELQDKLQELARTVFETFSHISSDFETGSISQTEFVECLKLYRELINGSDMEFIHTSASWDVKRAIKEHLPTKAIKS